ncbi:MAG: outer-membrane lipoprotein carrier protein LolA, partial [Ideonella sp.]|nr:outer-membrane lipoprotein carrier protein LolA [Ideonella sp.]
ARGCVGHLARVLTRCEVGSRRSSRRPSLHPRALRRKSSGSLNWARPNRFALPKAKPFEQLIVSDGKDGPAARCRPEPGEHSPYDQALGATPAALSGVGLDRDFTLRRAALARRTRLGPVPKVKGGNIESLQGFRGMPPAALELQDAFGRRSVIRSKQWRPM